MVTLDTVVSLVSNPLATGVVLLASYTCFPKFESRIIAGIVVLYFIIKHLNTLYKQRGPWESLGPNDVALITGGSNGLGLEISKLLLAKQVKVINLDVSTPQDESGAIFFKCDLKNESQTMDTINEIKKQFGVPTIFINNAAIRHSESLTDLSYIKINDLLQVNTISPIVLLKEILKDVDSSKRLYVVTMASILGLVSPANLSIYSATKSALVSLHDSLSHENKSPNIRFLLATPGQLDTRLFSDVKPPRQFFAPVVKAKDLAFNIVTKIELGERGTLHGPLYTYFIPALRLLPFMFGEFARSFSQMDTSVKQD